MSETYFEALKRTTETRFWINNPTAAEIGLSIAQGAVGCTTNPAYCARLLSEEPAFLRSLIDSVIETQPGIDQAATEVYRRAAKRIMEGFSAVHDASRGKEGFVTIQGDPRHDEDTAYILRISRECQALGPNFMTKIPVIPGAIDAIEGCIAEGMPVCATEVFSISQAELVCDTYAAACARGGKMPPLYITHISGIFDEYLQKLAARTGVEIAPETLKWAGIAIARKEQALIGRRGFANVMMMGGGARGMHHFTGLVGDRVCTTINWSTAVEIMASGERPSRTIDAPVPARAIDELREKFADFRKAYDDGALPVSEFAGYGPVQLFRSMFLKGWYLLLSEVAARKAARAL